MSKLNSNFRTFALLLISALLLYAPHVRAQTILVSDDFNGASRDTTKWSVGTVVSVGGAAGQDTSITESQATGQLVLTAPPFGAGTGYHYNGRVLVTAADFSNSRASVEVINAPTSGIEGQNTYLGVFVDGNNYYEMHVDGNFLNFNKDVAGVKSSAGSLLTYNATAHRFWAIRRDSGTGNILFEASADGTTWTTLRSLSDDLNLITAKVELSYGLNYSGSSTSATFDNFALVSVTGASTPTPTPTPTPAPLPNTILLDDINAAPYINPFGLPPYTAIAADRYKAQGVLLSGATFGPFVGFWVRTGRPNGFLFAANYEASPTNSGPAADGVVTINFVLPGTTTPGRTNAVSFRVAGTESTQTAAWTARAYNNAGALLDTVTGTTDAQVTFSRPAGDISRVTFTATTAAQDPQTVGHFEGIDTLSFGNIVAQ